MIRIKICQKKQSDATELTAKGWHISIFRDIDETDEFVTAEKNEIKFILRTSKEHPEQMELKKYVHGFYRDTKMFFGCGTGINGTLCISEGKTTDATYAFFRNAYLQDLMDKYQIRKIVFPKEDSKTIEKDVYFDPKSKYANDKACIELSSEIPFVTDGSYESEASITEGVQKWHIKDATFVYEYAPRTLTIPWTYDIGKLDSELGLIYHKHV